MTKVYGWSRQETDWQVNPPPAGFGIALGTIGPPGSSDSTLMRTILHGRFSADATMGATPAINEYDFFRMTVRMNATWADQNISPGFIADPATNDPGECGLVTFTPEVTRHWTNAGELLIYWRQEFESDQKGRHAVTPGIGASPGVTAGLWVTGIGNNLFRHTVPYPIVWSGQCLLETLWYG